MSIRKTAKDEVFSPSYKAEGDKVTASFGCKFNMEGDRFALTSVLDFTGVTKEELLEMAAREPVAEIQRLWRLQYAADRATATTKNTNAVFSVRSYLDSPRKRTAAPALQKANKLIKELKPEEQMEVVGTSIAAMSAEQKAELRKLLDAA